MRSLRAVQNAGYGRPAGHVAALLGVFSGLGNGGSTVHDVADEVEDLWECEGLGVGFCVIAARRMERFP